MAVVSLCLLNGCLHLEQKLQFLRDGSVIAAYHYAVPAAMLPALTAAQDALEQQLPTPAQDDAASAQPMNWFLNETAVRNFFQRPESNCGNTAKLKAMASITSTSSSSPGTVPALSTLACSEP